MRTGAPFRLGLAAALVAGALACTFSREITVRGHQLLKPLPPGFVTAFNLEERLRRGYILEVAEFLSGSGGRGVERTRGAKLLGQALLERGDFRVAGTVLERAHVEEGRLTERAQVAWQIAQTHYWTGRFAESARWVEVARAQGLRLPEGWLTFLRSAGDETPYSGVEPGTRITLPMDFGRPRLPRVAVSVNGKAVKDAVFDTGASLSLLTESAARRLGVERVPDAVAGAYGLHREEIEMGFGWARTITIGAATLHRVPFGILPDEALSFQTTSSGAFRPDGVLGVHLLKEFDWLLAYPERKVHGVRLDPQVRRGSSGQNLFFRRLKPMVRASINQEPWFLFLLDTGSEPTMVTRMGIQSVSTRGTEASYPMTLEGIGQSRVSWGKLSNVTVGVDRFMVRFADIIVKEDPEGLEDGIVGSSFLSNFDVEVRFGSMAVRLENPAERYLRAREAAEEAPSPRR